jgi:IS30 family transposase
MEERSIIQNLHAAGKGVKEIAWETGRSLSSVSREQKQNETYHAWRGMSLYLHRRKSHVRKRQLLEGAAWEYALGRLKDGWPPEAIEER